MGSAVLLGAGPAPRPPASRAAVPWGLRGLQGLTALPPESGGTCSSEGKALTLSTGPPLCPAGWPLGRGGPLSSGNTETQRLALTERKLSHLTSKPCVSS